MLAISCDHCKKSLNTGVGRWIADNGAITFFCSGCEERVLVSATQTEKPLRGARRANKEANGRAEEIVPAA